MNGNAVRPAGTRPCEVKPVTESDDLDALAVTAPAPKPVAEKSMTDKVKTKFHQWFTKSTKR
jgi:hypothetical protein